MKKVLKWIVYATIPVALLLQFTHRNLVLPFVFSCIAVLPVAAWIGHGTEHLAHRLGPTYGALAVFAYLIINGQSNRYEGVQLLAVHAIIAVAMFFLP